jgi:ferritin-like metal-binding protein YciE
MAVKSLEDLFVHDLRDILDAERQILKALPKMSKSAESEALASALDEHKRVTQGQVERLETIFEQLEMAARGKHCKGMEGLLAEGDELVAKEDTSAALDAAMIGAAQKVEHYEIAAYGTLATYANMLGMQDAASLLGESLAEEKEADETLSALASELNLAAQEQATK